MLRVVIADDSVDVLAALHEVIEADPRCAVAGQATTGPDAVDTVRRQCPDVVLLDIRMPGDGLVAARAIQALDLPVTVMVCSTQVAPSLVTALLRAGVRAVLPKGRIGADLPDLMELCVAGAVLLLTPGAAEGLRGFGQGS